MTTAAPARRPLLARVNGVVAGGVRAAAAAATSGGTQNFLGARWVEGVLRRTPARARERSALLLLSLSPHYFYSSDLRAEAERNRASRAQLVDDVLLGHLRPGDHVIDYGCGPGYMAAAVATHVREVEAIDASPGVLSCARVLNAAANLRYETLQEAAARTERADLAYSFAVVQHLTDDALRDALALLRRRVRPGGTLLLHFPVPDGTWRTEEEWRSDSSARGRARLRFGLHCFGRDDARIQALVTAAGFLDPQTSDLRTATKVDDDVARQRLLIVKA